MERDMFGRWKHPKYQKGDITYNRDTQRIEFKPDVLRHIKSDWLNKDVDKQIRKMEQWLLTHRLKSNWVKFVTNWLTNSEDKIWNPDKPKPQRSSGTRRPIVNPKTGESKPAPLPTLADILRETGYIQ